MPGIKKYAPPTTVVNSGTSLYLFLTVSCGVVNSWHWGWYFVGRGEIIGSTSLHKSPKVDVLAHTF